MMRPESKVEKVYLYPRPVDFRKSIDGLAALVELDIKVALFDPLLFFPQQVPQPHQGVVLGTQWLLPLAQAPGSRTFQNLTRGNRRGHHPHRPGIELAARWFRPLA